MILMGPFQLQMSSTWHPKSLALLLLRCVCTSKQFECKASLSFRTCFRTESERPLSYRKLATSSCVLYDLNYKSKPCLKVKSDRCHGISNSPALNKLPYSLCSAIITSGPYPSISSESHSSVLDFPPASSLITNFSKALSCLLLSIVFPAQVAVLSGSQYLAPLLHYFFHSILPTAIICIQSRWFLF